MPVFTHTAQSFLNTQIVEESIPISPEPHLGKALPLCEAEALGSSTGAHASNTHSLRTLFMLGVLHSEHTALNFSPILLCYNSSYSFRNLSESIFHPCKGANASQICCEIK